MIRTVGKLVRHPSLIPITFDVVISYVRNDYAGEFKARNQLREVAARLGTGNFDTLRWRSRDAELLLRTGEVDEARKRLLAILKETEASDEADNRHYNLFAKYWISIIDGKPDQANYWARIADQDDIHTLGQNEIPPPPVDRLTKEWDEEVEALTKRHPLKD